MLNIAREIAVAKAKAKAKTVTPKTKKTTAKKKPAAKKAEKKAAPKAKAAPKTDKPKGDLLAKFKSGEGRVSAESSHESGATEGNVSHNRPAATAEKQKIGVWTIHADPSGGVAAIHGKTVHVFTGKMAKASAVAFAKNHTEETGRKKATKKAKMKLSDGEEQLRQELLSAHEEVHKNRPKFAMIQSRETPEQKTEIKKSNQKIHDAHSARVKAVEGVVAKIDKADVSANFWKQIGSDLKNQSSKSGKDARKKVIQATIRDPQIMALQSRKSNEETHGIF